MKYIRLNEEQTELKSGLYSIKPKQIRRFDDTEISKYRWFRVKEKFETIKNPQYYIKVRDSWEVKNDFVVIHYTNKLKDIETLRNIIISEINTKRNEQLKKPLEIDGYMFDQDEKSISRLDRAVSIALTDDNYETDWITANNEIIHFNRDDILAVSKKQTKYEEDVIFFARNLKDKVLTSDAPHEIDFNSDWPSTTP